MLTAGGKVASKNGAPRGGRENSQKFEINAIGVVLTLILVLVPTPFLSANAETTGSSNTDPDQ